LAKEDAVILILYDLVDASDVELLPRLQRPENAFLRPFLAVPVVDHEQVLGKKREMLRVSNNLADQIDPGPCVGLCASPA
jgi:hypothetical protein